MKPASCHSFHTSISIIAENDDENENALETWYMILKKIEIAVFITNV